MLPCEECDGEGEILEDCPDCDALGLVNCDECYGGWLVVMIVMMER